MTAEEAYDLLLAGGLKIDIHGASVEDFRKFQEITDLKWKNGEDLYSPISERYTSGKWYICREKHYPIAACLALSSSAGSDTMTISEFLGLSRVKIDESEFEKMFYDC